MEIYKVKKDLGNLVNDNIKKIESIFPSVVKDGEVDFEELRELLGDFKEVDKEKYEMNWVGKKEAKRIALEPLYGKTLKYIEGDGKNEDTTENLYIEGDNLEVLKLLQNSYYGKVKMIYIDPPYNTGNDFIYNDKFKSEKSDIEILEGDRNEHGERLIKNQKESGYYHSKWLSMMYSRLLMCKNILRDDGVIFISIGQDEVHNIIKICDEIYGERNRIGICSRVMKSGGNKGNFFSPNIDYVLVYSKDIDLTKYFRDEISDESLKNYYNNIETDGLKKGERFGAERIYVAGLDYRPNQRYWIECPDGSYVIPPGVNFPSIIKEGEKITPNSQDGVWKWTYERYLEEKNSNNILFKETKTSALINQDGEKSKYNLYNKIWLNDRLKEGRVPSDFITKYENRHSSKELKELKIPFSFAKPTGLIKYLMPIMNHDKSDIILDFFSGSATTADAVIQLNLEDGLQRKFIMVQIPEKTNTQSEAYKSGYKNICEIGKERIRRAGDEIIRKNKDNQEINNLDIGFKVFKVENSNIKWENRINEDNQLKYNLDGVNIDDIDFMPNTKDIDVVYEILLRHYGIPLTAKIDKLDFIGERTYTIAYSIVVCLETKITKEIVDKISELEPIKVIFRDSAFGEDISLKQNSVHRLNVLIEKNNKNTTHVVEFI